jgi:ribosome-interacting GTPase 1
MPTNLPPEYYSAEAIYKQAATPQDKIATLESLIATIPKHKGTDKLRADFRKRLSKLREDAAKKKKGGRGDLYTVEKQGAAQAVLVGFANAGKSSLLAAVSHAHPVIADFPMSTVMPLSGMMPYEDIQFQIVDLPPVGNESTDGWVSGILRNANMIILVVDLMEDPDIQTELLIDQIAQWRIPILRKSDSMDKAESMSGKPVVITANKYDLPDAEKKLIDVEQKYIDEFSIVPVSAKNRGGADLFKRAVLMNSGVIRVYSKEPGKEADMAKPFTLFSGSSVLDLAQIIHKDFVAHLKYACIWGSGKFDGQRVQKDYVLQDKDIVEYHVK